MPYSNMTQHVINEKITASELERDLHYRLLAGVLHPFIWRLSEKFRVPLLIFCVRGLQRSFSNNNGHSEPCNEADCKGVDQHRVHWLMTNK